MAESFRLQIVTPEGQLLDQQVVEVTAPGIHGEFGVLPHHARFMTALGIGELRYRTESGSEGLLAVAGGFAEVNPEGVSVLAQTAENAEKIDVARAEAALRRAQQRLADAEAGVDVERASIAIERSQARLRVAQARGVKATRTQITTTEMPIPGEKPE
jgi:F-type H+-transporting ATPase subunit epsilon